MQDVSRTASGYPAPASYSHSNWGTAHSSYVAPLPYSQSPNNPDPNYNNQARSCRQTCKVIVICVVIVLVLSLIVVGFIIYPTPPDFQVDSLSLTNFSANSQSVTGKWSVEFLVRNNDQMLSVNYDLVTLYIFYKGSYLSETNLAPFEQGKKSETTFNATLSAIDTYAEPEKLGNLNAERSHGSILFDLVLDITSFWSSYRGSVRWPFRVSCLHIPVGILSNSSEGELLGGSRLCRL